MTSEQDVEAVLIELVRAIVEDEAAVRVETILNGGEAILQVRVARNDIGKFVGQNSRTAKSLMGVMDAISATHGKRYTLNIQW